MLGRRDATHNAGQTRMTVNLENYKLIIDEDFDGSKEDLNLHDGTSGLWSTDMEKGNRVHNSKFSLFGDPDLTDAEGNDLGLDPFTVEDGVLSINVSRVDPDKQDDIQTVLDASPYVMAGAQDASDIEYLTGMLSLHQSWAESYGYYEVRVKMPAGTGHLSAPWLTSAHEGWPPEINMEALGRYDGSNGRGIDDAIWTNVLFNDYGIGEEADQAVHDSAGDITNIYGEQWESANQAMLDKYGWDESQSSPGEALHDPDNNEKYVYKRLVELDEVTGEDVDIHEEFYTYGIEWTPDHISFLFGSDSSNMHEIFRTQTPDDVTTDMYFVLWNQFGGSFAWNPDDDDNAPFESSLDVDYIFGHFTTAHADLHPLYDRLLDQPWIAGDKAPAVQVRAVLDGVGLEHRGRIVAGIHAEGDELEVGEHGKSVRACRQQNLTVQRGHDDVSTLKCDAASGVL